CRGPLAPHAVLAPGRVMTAEELERRVAERTLELETRAASLDAFVQFSEVSATLIGVRELAGHAVRVLRSTLGEVSVAYFEPENGLWRACVLSEDVDPEVVAVLQAGVPMDAPSYAIAVSTHQPFFAPGWDARREGVAHAERYGAAAFYPLFVTGKPYGLLTMGVLGRADWNERERSVFRAVGSSLNLALERSEAALALHARNAELNARTQALQGFAALTRNLALRGDPHLLTRRALEVILSLMTPGYALYYEPEAAGQGTGAQAEVQGAGHWRSRVQLGDVGNADLQAFIDAGPPIGELPTLDLPWQTRKALYQDNYAKGTDTPSEMVQHVSTVASLPVMLYGQPAGVLIVALFGERAWSPTDRVVLETVVGSLEQALERAEQADRLREQNAELVERGAALARSNEELQAANEELEAFSYSVSHDLRTPVRHIKGFSELARKALAQSCAAQTTGAAPSRDAAPGSAVQTELLRLLATQNPASQSPSEQATEYMHVVEKAALRMSALIDAMLDLSRTSRQEMRLGVVDLNLLAARAMEDVQPDTLERVMEWRMQRLPLVMGDRASLQQVMTNLFSNAVKYSRTRAVAVIEVWAEQTDSEWSVHVRDNGVGFDANYQDKLFGVFQRLHSEREFEGTGIGLATVRRIVLRHGGRVSARSGPDQTGPDQTGPGQPKLDQPGGARGVQDQGATFSFTLPKPG
ncbi:ATP-binding protein, partial [Deinococcus sp.]|uniref:ATP-binding protein n=1 Tax=Deinococcus sp. TaxID=47478 RepID=UPI00286E9260